MENLPLLKAAPPLQARREPVPLPELGGSVIVRGLLASESFAIVALRQQVARQMRLQAADDDGPPGRPIEAGFDDFVRFGKHVTQLLAVAVLCAGGTAFYTADEWEVFYQHHPDAFKRLQLVAERLSGLDEEAVAKNSPQSPSSSSGSGSASDTPAAPQS